VTRALCAADRDGPDGLDPFAVAGLLARERQGVRELAAAGHVLPYLSRRQRRRRRWADARTPTGRRGDLDRLLCACEALLPSELTASILAALADGGPAAAGRLDPVALVADALGAPYWQVAAADAGADPDAIAATAAGTTPGELTLEQRERAAQLVGQLAELTATVRALLAELAALARLGGRPARRAVCVAVIARRRTAGRGERGPPTHRPAQLRASKPSPGRIMRARPAAQNGPPRRFLTERRNPLRPG
jgi:hypothetical protein